MTASPSLKGGEAFMKLVGKAGLKRGFINSKGEMYMAVSLNLITFDESIYTKEDINRYTNEELIDFIHKNNYNMYWELLWIKTKNCVYRVFNTSVNSYNKDKNSEEIFSVLMQAWIHAVNTYDKNKATSEFYKYAIYIIRQQYSRYASRINAQKTGRSVKHVYLEDYVNEKTSQDSSCGLLDVIEDKEQRIIVIKKGAKFAPFSFIVSSVQNLPSFHQIHPTIY